MRNKRIAILELFRFGDLMTKSACLHLGGFNKIKYSFDYQYRILFFMFIGEQDNGGKQKIENNSNVSEHFDLCTHASIVWS